jgi:2-methylaconitate cis-trans-isomerase PrpF
MASGSKTGKTLPTGKVTDVFEGVSVTCIDVANPCVFVQASDLEVEGGILADAIDAHPTLLSKLEAIRIKAAVAMGIAEDEKTVPGSIPKVAIVSAPYDHAITGGNVRGKDCDLLVRAISVGQPHRAVPITVAMALAVASRLEGSVVHRNTSRSPVDADGITIGHNSGRLLVGANFHENGEVKNATCFRTARRIMSGAIYWKAANKFRGSED